MNASTISETRRQNILHLINERFAGKQIGLARAINRKPDYIWRIVNQHKGVGEELARTIEGLLELPANWLDDPTHASSPTGSSPIGSRIVVISPLEQAARSTLGLPMFFNDLQLSNVSELDARVVAQIDDTMSLTFQIGDSIVIDTSATVASDGVFFLRIGKRGSFAVRRLSTGAGGAWIVRCDTHDKARHPDVFVTESDLEIIGRVFWTAGRR